MVSQYANDDYLNPAPTGQQIQSPQPQAPQPQGGGMMQNLSDQWDQFISHPEHRAGMMQFAVNMLSGRGLGESIGSAAEATGRNVQSQKEEQQYEEALALKQQEAARKEKETEYYGIGQKRTGAAEDRYMAHQDAMFDRQSRAKARDAFYAFKNEPGVGMGIWKQVQAKYPELKDKSRADMKPEHDAYARRLIESQMGIDSSGGGTPVYDKATGALKGYWNGKRYIPGAPE